METTSTSERSLSGERLAYYLIGFAAVLALVIGTIRLTGSNANNVFSSVASAIGDDSSSTSGFAGRPDVVVHPTPPGAEQQKLVRKASMKLVVSNPADSAEQIRQLVEKAGGYVVTSEISGTADANDASLSVRVPVARFEEVRAAIHKLSLKVEEERRAVEDVTRQYVDDEARLRNLRAEEAQYLSILKMAKTVKDTLAVSDKMSEVRGEIEQEQAEFETLARQTQTVELAIVLLREFVPMPEGLHWRPWLRIKEAGRDGLDAVADYASSMVAVVFYLPSILLWTATILFVAAGCWKIIRWVVQGGVAGRKAPADSGSAPH